MHRATRLDRWLAVVGTVLVWLPIAGMLLTSFVGSLRAGRFLMDYLMPAELFRAFAAGAALLAAASWRTGRRRRWIATAAGGAVAALVLAMGMASVTGLASGAAPASGWPRVVVTTALAVYTGALVATGVGGGALLRDLAGVGRG